MKITLRIFMTVFAVLGIHTFFSAATEAKPLPPTTNLSYLGALPGGRPLAMGYAFTAVGDDPAMIYFNPAGLASNDSSLFTMTYEAIRQSELTTDQIFSGESLRNTNIDFLAIEASKAALSWRPLANVTTETTGTGADFKKTELRVNSYTLSAATKNDDKLSSGLNLSYISADAAESSIQNGVPFANIAHGNGLSIDLGFLYTVAPQLRLGLDLQNLFGMVWWDDYEDEQLPTILRAGFSFQITQMTIFAADYEKRYYRKALADPSDDKAIAHFGLEQEIGSIFSVRAGIFGPDLNDNETTHLTAGIGYQQNKYSLSLAGEKYRLNQTDVFRYLFSLDLPM